MTDDELIQALRNSSGVTEGVDQLCWVAADRIAEIPRLLAEKEALADACRAVLPLDEGGHHPDLCMCCFCHVRRALEQGGASAPTGEG